MTKFNLSHANFSAQVKSHPTPTPSPQCPIIKKGERGEGGGVNNITSHNEWKEKFLEEGETISIPLRGCGKGGGMLKIPRIEIISCMEKLYSQRVMINPSESQQGIYEEAKKIIISRYLRKEGLVKKGKGGKFPRPSWVNPKYR